MYGEGQETFRTVLQLVEEWRPEKAYGHENKFQSELQDWLDTELNASRDSFGVGGGGSYVVSTERGVSRGDVVVDDLVGIELKREFSNSQKKKLRGQLEDYADNYPFVIACACGIEDIDGWREIENKFTNQGGMGVGLQQQTEFAFVHKRQENYGADPGRGGGGGFLDGGLFGGL